jgi:hypothetical protein
VGALIPPCGHVGCETVLALGVWWQNGSLLCAVPACAETKEEQEREQQILGILEMFRLQGGPHQTELIMAKSGDRLLGVALCERWLK